jgi:IS5 family transposase
MRSRDASDKKDNQWYFSMKGHIGVDSKQKTIHSIDVMLANVHDSQIVAGLLHGRETKVWGDSAYRSQREAIRTAAPKASEMTNKRRARYKALTDADRSKNRTKSKVRSRIEHSFLVIKKIFGFSMFDISDWRRTGRGSKSCLRSLSSA